MTETETLQRLELLYLVLQFCTREQEKGRKQIFTQGERIEINQERGSRFEYLSYLKGEHNESEVRKAIVAQSIEEKIAYCLNLIIKNQWKGNAQSHFLEHLKRY
ncbi:hypothetical protein KHA90_15750 [Flavobacterium psychroterrae]|uniref:Uncharacterized protein n=1 Tax=Flavobacterium psychroterrae TaxID=2133767 RepID=A0ABS5PDV2_9FLAO|nr:hypothetical protein [Flavobacterium psychroterrae]MBS7232473.1 hypothetical protein [Flavobacterium psychroterrae]